MILNPSGVETRISQDNWLNTIDAGALAPWIARSLPTMEITLQDAHVLVFDNEGIQLPVPFQ